jgi:hypothetical protein
MRYKLQIWFADGTDATYRFDTMGELVDSNRLVEGDTAARWELTDTHTPMVLTLNRGEEITAHLMKGDGYHPGVAVH